MNKCYEPFLTLKIQSMLLGEHEEQVTPADGSAMWDIPIVQAFIADDDLQQMQIVSTNIGDVRTLTKHYHD